MNKKQRLIIVFIVLLIIGYGTWQNDQRTLSFYVLRTTDGVTFVKDSTATFTNVDIKHYDHIKKELHFTDDYMKKINDGFFMKHHYILDGKTIAPEDYKFEGISPLGAKYPDRFVFEIDGKEVLNGYFETSVYSSYLPPGKFVKSTGNGIRIIQGFEEQGLISENDVLAMYFGNI